jgi:hypothetical protein
MSEINPYKAPASPAEQQEGVAVAGLAVTTSMLGHLRSTRPWVRFLAVMGFIGLGFMLFAALMMVLISVIPSMRTGSFPGALLALVYLVLAAVYLWPLLSLHRFGRALTRLLAEGSGEALEGAFRQQFSFWKAVGILTIVVIGLTIAAVPIFAIIGVASRK